ncbi:MULTISPECIES: hypothetical protein [Staphylococcus]|uniref:hypothetical protein n=1 Tax=Staphylococcus TaxID=1279 RepID=UPI000302DDDF|nr:MULTISPECIES: hypothetical protein [Staphylococcus]MBU6943835.1 hypothetical protein [Staphylococcus sp. CWZ226]MDQ7114231.1 hypothetical protein [Staphylococcus simulans]MDQ7140103.1 hypothetical protein [Staphylococcus simulans]OFP27692.1 hypothetical protein HMPREF2997_04370 [Staphylococcus sp. HMSC057C08]WML96977.1 hypothetical protein RCG53_10010 [Staphylococcus simulans]
MAYLQDNKLFLEMLKFLLPVIFAVIASVYNYFIANRNSIDNFNNILSESVFKLALYLPLLYMLSQIQIVTVTMIIALGIYFSEFIYILCKNKSFKIVNLDNNYYRLLKENKGYIKVQGLKEVYEEYSTFNSSVNSDVLKNSKKEELEFNKVEHSIIHLKEGDRLKYYAYYLNRNVKNNRKVKFKWYNKFIFIVLFVIVYYLKDASFLQFIKELLPSLLTSFFIVIMVINAKNINVVRYHNKLHIISTIKQLNEKEKYE